jgi:hypothetical protein
MPAIRKVTRRGALERTPTAFPFPETYIRSAMWQKNRLPNRRLAVNYPRRVIDKRPADYCGGGCACALFPDRGRLKRLAELI